MKCEYLIIFDNQNQRENYCINEHTFNNIVESNSDVIIEKSSVEDYIIYKDIRFKYKNQNNFVDKEKGEKYYFNITIESEEGKGEEEFTYLLSYIKNSMIQKGAKLEVLWDSISLKYCEKAYPLIYKIENLMRKLLTKFMLISVGHTWGDLDTPTQKVNKDRIIDGYLYGLDFKDLPDLLFKKYSVKIDHEKMKELINRNGKIVLEDLSEFENKSNWERYLLDKDDKYSMNDVRKIMGYWEKIYDLRCKVAHNFLINKNDYEQLVELINKVQPILEEKVLKLDVLKLERDSKEIIEDNIGLISKPLLIGLYIIEYTQLSKTLEHCYNYVYSNESIIEFKMNEDIIKKWKEVDVFIEKEWHLIAMLIYIKIQIEENSERLKEEELKQYEKDSKSLRIRIKEHYKDVFI